VENAGASMENGGILRENGREDVLLPGVGMTKMRNSV